MPLDVDSESGHGSGGVGGEVASRHRRGLLERKFLFRVLTFALLILTLIYFGMGFRQILNTPGPGDSTRILIERHYKFRGQNPYDVAFRDRALRNGESPPITTRDAMPDPKIGMGFGQILNTLEPGDVTRRWIEQQYVFRGQNPYDVAFRDRALRNGESPPITTRDAMPDPKIGIPVEVDYPPWTYFSGYVLFWPNASYYPIWYACCMALGLVVILGWTYQMAGDCDRSARLFLVTCVSAASAFRTDIGTGNFGIIVLALIILGYQLTETGRRVGAGVILGVSLLKPTLSGPFMLAHLARREIGTLVAATAYLVFASLVVWKVTNTDPLEMLRQMLQASRHFVGQGYGPLNLAIALGLPYNIAVMGTAFGALAVGFGAMVAYRDQPLIVLYAIAAVTARLWTYHLVYSNLILIFLVIALWREAIRRSTPTLRVTFALAAFSLWIPSRVAAGFAAVNITQHLIWIVAIVILLRSTTADSAQPAQPADC